MATTRVADHRTASAFVDAMLVSLVVHGVLFAVFLLHHDRPGTPRLLKKKALVISFMQSPRRPASTPASVPTPMVPHPAALSPVPTQRLVSPPRPKPAPLPPPSQRPVAAIPSPPLARPAPLPPPPESPTENLLGRIHDNWLQPPGTPGHFRCRLHIEYGPGGAIVAVRFPEQCVGSVIDDSIARAVWKSQSIPLPVDAGPSGSIDVEFSP